MKSIKIIMIVLVGALLIGGVAYYFHVSNVKSARTTAFEWSGIHELPSWAVNPEIQTRGSALTREFTINFTGTKEQINDWIKNEPVLQDIKSTDACGDVMYISSYLSGDDTCKSIKLYVLKPQGGAQWAQVMIDLIHNKVIIRTYWS